MSVLIDTPIWSLALRRKSVQLNGVERGLVDEWKALIRNGNARLAGIVRQEVLSGIKGSRDFEKVREHLAAFEDLECGASDHERAASFFNSCRSKGVTPTSFDMLICSLATRHRLDILTADADFHRYAEIIPIALHRVSGA